MVCGTSLRHEGRGCIAKPLFFNDCEKINTQPTTPIAGSFGTCHTEEGRDTRLLVPIDHNAISEMSKLYLNGD